MKEEGCDSQRLPILRVTGRPQLAIYRTLKVPWGYYESHTVFTCCGVASRIADCSGPDVPIQPTPSWPPQPRVLI